MTTYPLTRITKKTLVILNEKKKQIPSLSNPKIIEFAVQNMDLIPIKPDMRRRKRVVRR